LDEIAVPLNPFTGLAPRIMGIGPSIAIPMVLKNAGITKEDVDLFEVGRQSSDISSGGLAEQSTD
jgi:acetyl-CoA acetyltransferase